jgi:hypothetical protein
VQASQRLSGGILAAAAYAFLGVADMGLSSVAFVLGVREANPMLAWMAAHGLFVPAKLLLTGLIAALMVWVYAHGRARPIIWGAVLLMGVVDVYHIWGLAAL